jgi:hypothetical protein
LQDGNFTFCLARQLLFVGIEVECRRYRQSCQLINQVAHFLHINESGLVKQRPHGPPNLMRAEPSCNALTYFIILGFLCPIALLLVSKTISEFGILLSIWQGSDPLDDNAGVS